MAEINAASMAQQLATAYTQQTQSLLDTQNKASSAKSTALTKLNSALKAFATAMNGLSSATGKKSMNQLTAGFADTTLGTATASATALPGSYPVFVEQLATKHQIAFEDLPAVPVAAGGTLGVQLGNGTAFNVDLGTADTDGDGTLSQVEIARAINGASGNGGSTTAIVMSSGGTTQLMLSSGQSGLAGKITLDTSGLAAGALKDKLDSTPKELVAAQDAVVWMGAQGTGIRLQQSSNTLTAIDGVTINLTKAMKPGDPAAVFTVAKDDAGTAANVKTFIDAFNALEATLDGLSANGNSTSGTAAGALASDSGLRALRSRMSTLLRSDFDGLNLRGLGISVDRSGSLSLDTAKLTAALTSNPTALDTVFGNTSLSNPKGLFGELNKTLDQWTNATGLIRQRQDSVQATQKAITTRQTRLDTQYEQAYQRYLKQFTALQEIQSRFSDTSGLLASLPTFGATTS